MTSRADRSAVVLEIRDRQVGVLVPERAAYRFFAAGPAAARLDGARFQSVAQGEHAVARLLG